MQYACSDIAHIGLSPGATFGNCSNDGKAYAWNDLGEAFVLDREDKNITERFAAHNIRQRETQKCPLKEDTRTNARRSDHLERDVQLSTIPCR